MSQFIKMGFMLNMHSETNFFYMCFSLILGKVKRCFKWAVIVCVLYDFCKFRNRLTKKMR